jgi:hypothetical protein
MALSKREGIGSNSIFLSLSSKSEDYVPSMLYQKNQTDSSTSDGIFRAGSFVP